MAARQPKQSRLALDTNVLLDLAGGEDFAVEFLKVVQANGFKLEIGPTVVEELTYLALQGEAASQKLALKALTAMRGWGISPFHLTALERGLVDEFSKRLCVRGLLPPDEKHDAAVLGEVSLAGIKVLVSSDSHLLDIEPASLAAQFAGVHFPENVQVFKPGTFLKAF